MWSEYLNMDFIKDLPDFVTYPLGIGFVLAFALIMVVYGIKKAFHFFY